MKVWKKNLFTLLIILVALPACHPTIKQEEKKLISHYTFRSRGLDKRFIDAENNFGRNVIYADVTDYASSDSFILAQQKPSVKYLKNHVGFYLYFRYLIYSDYLRHPAIINEEDNRSMKWRIEGDSINYQLFLARHASEKSTAADKAIQEAIADSLINHDPYYKKISSGETNYWIIQISTDSLLGPFSKTAYLQERKLLHIPADLTLKSEE